MTFDELPNAVEGLTETVTHRLEEIVARLDRIESPDVFPVEVVALKLSITSRTVHDMIKRGDLDVVKVGGATRVTRTSYLRFLEENASRRFTGDRRRRLGPRVKT